jgi:hypothetical protein
MPIKMAFSDASSEHTESLIKIIFYIVDSLFLTDLILQFFSTVMDPESQTEVTNRHQIA